MFRFITTSTGLRLRVAVQGQGPLVLMVHGFPESWYSWRHQMTAVAGAGYMAAALEVRGYGQSDSPALPADYTLTKLARDIIDVIDALSDDGTAVLFGHDWGAMQVQAAALIYPDKIRALASLSVPAMGQAKTKPSVAWQKAYADVMFYQAYFQDPGVAEAEFEADIPRFLRCMFTSLSAKCDLSNHVISRPKGATALLDDLPEGTDACPDWLTQGDLDIYVDSFEHSGLRGPLNRYRCADLDWEELAAYADRSLDQPGLFIAGLQEPTRYMIPGIDRFADPVPRMTNLHGIHLLGNAGHWIQQEAPEQTNEILLRFLHGL